MKMFGTLSLVLSLLHANPLAATPGAPPDVKAAPPGASKSRSGLVWQVLRKGKGHQHPGALDIVEVHYSAWSADGRLFDTSAGRSGPTPFAMNSAPAGWAEGVSGMVAGEKRRLWIPAALAFGATGTPTRPGGPVVYDVELIAIRKAPEPPVVPPDVGAPPKSARRTRSGLAYRVLRRGAAKLHPREESVVEVHYSGWTPDGRLFDSTYQRGAMNVALPRAMPGWTEGLQLMVPGDKTRFWIPAALAHGDKPRRAGYPGGMLVFDIELVRIISERGITEEGEEEEEERD